MRVIGCALVWACLFLAARAEELPQARPEDVGLSADKLARVSAIVQNAVAKHQTAGVVVLVARRGKAVYHEGFGKLDLQAGQAMPTDAIFRIHSMSKPITSAAALILSEQGKLGLDDPVSKYLPEFQGLRVYAGAGAETVTARRAMTIRDLLRHTSGLTYGMPNGSPVDKLYIANKIEDPSDSLADLTRKLGTLPLQYQPGTRFQYSVSTDVLGRIIEVASGKALDVFLKEQVFQPLDMRDTGFLVGDAQANRLAASYRVAGNGKLQVIDAPATSRYRKPRKYLSGGGGLVSTARDYARFCQMLVNGGELQGTRLLSSESVQAMTTNQLPADALPMTLGGFSQTGLSFGFGVSVKLATAQRRSDRTAGEYGWSGAASTYFWVAPKAELIVIVLQQAQPFNFGLEMALKPAVYAAITD